MIEVRDGNNGDAALLVPDLSQDWNAQSIPPIEVIDGQHRLWAFGEERLAGSFQLPVVAFVGLDLSWQAYLFYTINIKPKKINASLAFDLYPLLRTEEWLTRFEGHIIYRETRAQELIDLLWAHPESPWRHRINMLGEPGSQGFMVTQASWVRSLLVSFIKRWEGPRVSIGGLFGSVVGKHETVLQWSRTEQAAFLIVFGQALQGAIRNLNEPWMQSAREKKFISLRPANWSNSDDWDDAFFGNNNLLNSDQGIRVLLQVVNDICFLRADFLGLHNWPGNFARRRSESSDEAQIMASISSLREHNNIFKFLGKLCTDLATYDWRASSAPDLKEEESLRKAAFRGSGGYKELRRDVLRHLKTRDGDVAHVAKEVIQRLGY